MQTGWFKEVGAKDVDSDSIRALRESAILSEGRERITPPL
jgi:hypothetical protein